MEPLVAFQEVYSTSPVPLMFRLHFSSKWGPFSICRMSRRESQGFAAFLPGWRRQRQACLGAARGEATHGLEKGGSGEM